MLAAPEQLTILEQEARDAEHTAALGLVLHGLQVPSPGLFGIGREARRACPIENVRQRSTLSMSR